MAWKVTGINAADLEILVEREDGTKGAVHAHPRDAEWKRACREVGWPWKDETRVEESRDPESLEARIEMILGDSVDIRQVKEAFGLLCAEIRELREALSPLPRITEADAENMA